MGSLGDANLRRPRPRGGPQPAGRVEAELLEWNGEPLSATLLVQRGESWEYGDEIEIRAWPAAIRERRVGERWLYWSGIECRLADFRAREAGIERPWLLAAVYPISTQWCARAPFLRAFDEQIFDPEGQPQDSPCDPFQLDPGWLTARLDDPLRIHWEDGQPLGEGYLLGRDRNRSAAHRDPRFDPKRDRPRKALPTWRFGLCADPEAAEHGLYLTFQNVIDRDTDGDLLGAAHANAEAFAPVAMDGYGPRPGVWDRAVSGQVERLPVTAHARKLADSMLRAAIRQAMAGRPKGSSTVLGSQIQRNYEALLEAFLKRESRHLDATAFAEGLLLGLRNGKKPTLTPAHRRLLRKAPPDLRDRAEAELRTRAANRAARASER